VTHLAARPFRRAVTVVASAGVLLAALPGAGAGPAAAQVSPADWPSFLYDTSHTSYNAAATSITPSNVSSLSRAWSWATPLPTNNGTRLIHASPTVVGGVVYIGVEDGYFYAISESTQAVLWSDFLGLDEPSPLPTCVKHAKGITATAAVADDPVTGTATVFVNAPDGHLYALDAQTGAVIWKGLVDTPSTTQNDYYAWGSPLVANGKVYVGISSDGDCPLIPGGVVAFDQSTGAQVARWIDVPTSKPKLYGGSVWSTPALLSNGNIVVATGNGYGGSGQPLYDESIVELDASTLAVQSYWQVPAAQQAMDSDFGASPTIWTATINGVSTPMVGDCNKNGFYYALKQNDLSAGPVWQAQITVPYPGGVTECDSSAVYDGKQLIVGGGASTTINGTQYPGSVQSLNPATGAVNWQTGLLDTIVGTPTEDGGGLVAAQAFGTTNASLGVFLLDAATGVQVGFIKTHVPEFGQAVFAGSDLIVGGGGRFGVKAFATGLCKPAGHPGQLGLTDPGTATSRFTASPRDDGGVLRSCARPARQ
jgi:outer membrane protein assembly factor BamB